MSDLREIFLQPECCADEHTGRLWCEDDAPVDCEDGVPWTRYVRADLRGDDHCKDCCCARSWAALGITQYTGKSIPEEIESLRSRLAEAEALLREARGEMALAGKYCDGPTEHRRWVKSCVAIVARIDAFLAREQHG